MEVSDRIVVMNAGRVEQVGKARDLYEHPANEFVMSFVGPVNRFGDSFVRPHDLEIELQPNGQSTKAVVERIVYLGFEVRVELVLDRGDRAWAQVTRGDADSWRLEEGQTVYVRPSRAKLFTR
jgi:sulfate transport system ATP-binding protein